MNSKTTFLLFTVILAVVLCQRIDAFTAGAGNIKKRDYNQVKLYSTLCYKKLYLKFKYNTETNLKILS